MHACTCVIRHAFRSLCACMQVFGADRAQGASHQDAPACLIALASLSVCMPAYICVRASLARADMHCVDHILHAQVGGADCAQGPAYQCAPGSHTLLHTPPQRQYLRTRHFRPPPLWPIKSIGAQADSRAALRASMPPPADTPGVRHRVRG